MQTKQNSRRWLKIAAYSFFGLGILGCGDKRELQFEGNTSLGRVTVERINRILGMDALEIKITQDSTTILLHDHRNNSNVNSAYDYVRIFAQGDTIEISKNYVKMNNLRQLNFDYSAESDITVGSVNNIPEYGSLYLKIREEIGESLRVRTSLTTPR